MTPSHQYDCKAQPYGVRTHNFAAFLNHNTGKIKIMANRLEDPARQDQPVRVKAEEARSFVEAVLVGNGVAEHNAKIVANCLVQADLRGVDT